MRWTINYYNQQVVDEVARWPSKMQAKYLRTLDLIERHGPKLGPPLTKALKNGLFEIRIKAQEGTGRAFFCYRTGNEIIILHLFAKKTQKIPKKELDIAKKRMKEVMS